MATILSCATEYGKSAEADADFASPPPACYGSDSGLQPTEPHRSATIATIRDERLLAEKLGQIGVSFPGHDALLRALESFVRTADDPQVVRIDPIPFAAARGIDEEDAIDLFLHGRKAGLFSMEWQCVCPGCGEIAQSFQSLRSANARFFCKVCIAERDADLSGFIEITFTLSRAVRESRYHDPASLDAESYVLDYRFTANGVVDGGPSLRDFYRKCAVLTAFVEPGETKSFPLEIGPGFLFFTSGPVVEVRKELDRPNPPVAFTHDENASEAPNVTVAPGTLEFVFTNPSAKRVPLLGINVPDHYQIKLERYLSGARLLSHQTFLDLFPSETIVSAEGLGVTEIALLFTDIAGSTALYERIGDVKAFQLVQQHFGLLRDAIRRHSGALVKTIGDAVMASFHRPLDALRASLEMRASIARFNEAVGEEMIALKMGAHVGTCLAVTLNGQLDYFGQAVNVAARIQGLASSNEICISGAMYRVPGAPELLAGYHAGRRAHAGQGDRPGDRRLPGCGQRLGHAQRPARRHTREAHRHGFRCQTPVALPDADVGRCREIAVVGKIRPIVRAARILARRRRADDDARYGDEVREVERIVPRQVERPRASIEANRGELRVEVVEPLRGAREARPVAHDARIVPHQVVQALAYRFERGGIGAPARKRRFGARDRPFQRRGVGLAPLAVAREPRRDRVAGNAAEYRRIGDTVAAQPVGAVHAARILAGHEESAPLRRAIRRELDAAHHVVRRGHDLDPAGREIEAAVGAALDHALELAPHVVRRRDGPC